MVDFKNRTTTSFNVSIGTGLMLESLFEPIAERYDEEREIPVHLKADDYNYHIYNLLTLVRNITNAVNPQVPVEVVMKDKFFVDTIIAELDQLNSLYSNTNLKPILYLPNFEERVELYNVNKNRELTKPVLTNLEVYKKLTKIKIWNELLPIPLMMHKLDGFNKTDKILITTSHAIDLFSKYEMELLTSHTGMLYKKHDFYRMYNKLGNNDMSIFPFYPILVYLIGDYTTSCIISAKVRAMLVGLALESKWNARTSESRVRSGVKSISELRDYVKAFKESKDS